VQFCVIFTTAICKILSANSGSEKHHTAPSTSERYTGNTSHQDPVICTQLNQ